MPGGAGVRRHCYRGDPLAANYGVFGVGVQSTLRTWLSPPTARDDLADLIITWRTTH